MGVGYIFPTPFTPKIDNKLLIMQVYSVV